MKDPQGSSFEQWLARTDGAEPPNDKERFGIIEDKAKAGCSFTASDMLWVINYLDGMFKLMQEILNA